jgi:hypothetical protein
MRSNHARGNTTTVVSRTNALAALAAALLTCVSGLAAGDVPQQGEQIITCTNLVSGASWQIRINFDRGTVDANPARIDGAKISWHDVGDGGNYTLDRKSGALTVVVASSTGGYFLHDHCRLSR